MSKRRVRLCNCPPGLFVFDGGHLGMKTEYATLNDIGVRQSDAYCVSSGEYFWGGTSDAATREQLLVTPIDVSAVRWN